MRIAVVSDTHGDCSRIITALMEAAPFDQLFFLGDYIQDGWKIARALDIPALAVRGNGDMLEPGEDEVVTEIGRYKIMLCHGHAYGVKNGLQQLRYRAQELGCNLVCFGHSHQPHFEDDGGITLINPGSPSRPLPPAMERSWGILEIGEAADGQGIVYQKMLL